MTHTHTHKKLFYISLTLIIKYLWPILLVIFPHQANEDLDHKHRVCEAQQFSREQGPGRQLCSFCWHIFKNFMVQKSGHADRAVASRAFHWCHCLEAEIFITTKQTIWAVKFLHTHTKEMKPKKITPVKALFLNFPSFIGYQCLPCIWTWLFSPTFFLHRQITHSLRFSCQQCLQKVYVFYFFVTNSVSQGK